MKYLKKEIVAVISIAATALMFGSVSAMADGGGNGNGQERMGLCHLESDGTYELKTLPIKAALKHLAKHDGDMEPVLDANGEDSCNFDQPSVTTCAVALSADASLPDGTILEAGTVLTVADYVDLRTDVSSYIYRTDADSCNITDQDTNALVVELYNGTFAPSLPASIRFYGTSPRVDLLITSDDVYNDCAFDLEMAMAEAQNGTTCPPLVVAPQ